MNKQFFKLLEEIDPNKFDMVYGSPNGMTVLRSSEYGFRLDQIHELKEKNFKLQARADKYKCRIDKAIEYIEKNIHFCENDSQGAYDVCNIRIASDKKLLEILKGKE